MIEEEQSDNLQKEGHLLSILKNRLAKGEITIEEFKTLKKVLFNDSNPDTSIPHISEDLETIIKINYNERRIAKSRIFVSRKQTGTTDYSPLEQDRAEFNSERIKGKDVTGYVDENWVRFKINLKKFRTKNARLISGGNYEFATDDDKGYSLMVTFAINEKIFKSLVLETLQKNGFGCMVGNTSASCHLREEYPTEEKARQILEIICKSINSKLYL